jgi:hypothetical protein
MFGRTVSGLAVLGLVAGGATNAQADTLSCPDGLGPGVTRQVIVTWDGVVNPSGTGECEAYGTGNIGPGGFENVSLTYDGETFPWIEKDDSGQANNGGILNIDIGPESGAFSFTTPGNYLLGLKFGNGQGDPDWVIVQLQQVNSGTFAWSGFATGLSHALVWGTPGGPPPVPEPASLVLFGGGLMAAGLMLRRRRV